MGSPVVHFEIGCRDKESTRAFFTNVFGWTTEDVGPTSMVDTGSDIGVQGHITSLGHEPHQYTTFYMQVDDIEATLQLIEQHGGKTVIPKMEVPNAGHFAWFNDPGGNLLGLWTPMQA